MGKWVARGGKGYEKRISMFNRSFSHRSTTHKSTKCAIGGLAVGLAAH